MSELERLQADLALRTTERDELRVALKRISRAHASAEHLQSVADAALAVLSAGKETVGAVEPPPAPTGDTE